MLLQGEPGDVENQQLQARSVYSPPTPSFAALLHNAADAGGMTEYFIKFISQPICHSLTLTTPPSPQLPCSPNTTCSKHSTVDVFRANAPHIQWCLSTSCVSGAASDPLPAASLRRCCPIFPLHVPQLPPLLLPLLQLPLLTRAAGLLGRDSQVRSRNGLPTSSAHRGCPSTSAAISSQPERCCSSRNATGASHPASCAAYRLGIAPKDGHVSV